MRQFSFSEAQKVDVEEFTELSSAEERLSWLMERTSAHPAIPDEVCTPERRVPGCLSGLWLQAQNVGDTLYFAARSESSMVNGIVSFICDLYSGRTASEVLEIGGALADDLGLERLLSLTRKRAVASTVHFIISTAQTTTPSVVGM